jgi:hypothetical protein
MLSDERLKEIRERAEKAAAGPWLHVHQLHIDQGAPHPDGTRLLSGGGWEDDYHLFTANDREFIAHARQDIPDLLAEIERLKGRPYRLMPRIGTPALRPSTPVSDKFRSAECGPGTSWIDPEDYH